MLALPLAASADTTANANAGLFINGSGIVRAIGAEVTAISGSVISAITHFGSNVITWSITTNGDTKYTGAATSSASIKVGDKISVAGTLTGVGSTLSVTATKVREAGDKMMHRIYAGTIASINAAAGTFVLTSGNTSTTVQTDGNTKFSLNGAASAFSSLIVGEKVGIKGTQSSTTSVVTATQVSARTEDKNKDDSDKGHGHGGLRLGGFIGLFGHGKDK